MIPAHELGRRRKCGQLDAEESGLLSPCFAVGKSLCESASVSLTSASMAIPPIGFGPINMREQAEILSARRPDTPR